MGDPMFWSFVGPVALLSQAVYVAALAVLLLRWEPKR